MKPSYLLVALALSTPAMATQKQVCTSTAHDELVLDFDAGEASFNGLPLTLHAQTPQNGATLDVLLTPSSKGPSNVNYTFHVQQWNAARNDGYTTLARQIYGRDVSPALPLTCR